MCGLLGLTAYWSWHMVFAHDESIRVNFAGLGSARASTSVTKALPRLIESYAPPPAVACVAKPGRACVAGQLWLSTAARSLWAQSHGSESFPFNTVKLTSRQRSPSPDNAELDDDDEPTAETNTRCGCDETFVGADGRYELQLLPGNYDLSVTSADDQFVGSLPSVQATEAAVIDHADFALNISLHLRGIVQNTRGVPLSNVQVVAKLSVAPGESQPWFTKLRTDDRGAFDLPHLQDTPYDLEFSAAQFRSATVSQAVPNKGELTIRMDRAPSLLGVVAEGKNGCPTKVTVMSLQGNVVTTSVEPTGCVFFFQRLPRGDQLKVSATIDGRLVEQHITVPAVGDPTTVCLGGPCSHAPAELLVMPVGAVADALFVATLDDDEGSLGQGMMTSGGFAPNRYYAFSGFVAGQTVRVGNSDDTTAQPRMTLSAGINEFVLPVRNVRGEGN
jgi:hypothetical protein